MLYFLSLSLLLFLFPFTRYGGCQSSPAPTVVIPQATIIGTTTTLPSATAVVNKFLGIPYAISPPERFEPPEPVEDSDDTIDATQWRDRCFEQTSGAPAAPGDTVVPASEDCLYLNVYAPANANEDGDKTVMFWIHGGGLQFGHAGQPVYDGSGFAAFQDVILVTINYRTNIFGFSNSPAINDDSKNAGLYDQRLALDWVQTNIASFGGDPAKITIFGESSGASSVDRLMTSPPDPVPYRAAILQSGQASVSAKDNPGLPSWKQAVSSVGCNQTTEADELKCMQSINGSLINQAVQKLALSFLPVNDNITQRATPLVDARSQEPSADVPTIIGSNSYEGSLLSAVYFGSAMQDNGTLSFSNIIQGLTGFLSPGLVAPIQDDIAAAFAQSPRALFFYLADYITYLIFQCPVNLISHANVQAGSPTYRYYFNATFPDTQRFYTYPDLNITNIGAYHAAEVPLVFGTYSVFGGNAMRDEIALSQFMQTSWADFAKDPFAPEAPGWPEVTANGTADVGCLGCSSNPPGVSIISESVDSNCSSYFPLYDKTLPIS